MSTDRVQIIFDNGESEISGEIIDSILSATEQFLQFSKVSERYITILFCGEQKIRELNKIYRQKDKVTDILSWSYDDEAIKTEELPWGELALCLRICEAQAAANGWNLETELVRLIAHGVVHLQGYDHETTEDEKKMLQLELELLSLIGLRDLYH